MENLLLSFADMDSSKQVNLVCKLIDLCLPFERSMVSVYLNFKYDEDDQEDKDKGEYYDNDGDDEDRFTSEGSDIGGYESDNNDNWENSYESDYDGSKEDNNENENTGYSDNDGDEQDSNGRDSDETGNMENEDNPCPYCLLGKCVTEDRQFWMPSGNARPSEENHLKRKDMYSRFYGTLKNANAFKKAAYIQKKLASIQALPPHLRRRRRIRREILPECVISIVHAWFPNIGNVGYMGHYWYNTGVPVV